MAWKQWIVVISFVIVHTCITFLLDVPDCGKGYLGPGGHQDQGKHFNCTGGAAGYIDRLIFGDHMYHHPTCQQVYENTAFYDPEGNHNLMKKTKIF